MADADREWAARAEPNAPREPFRHRDVRVRSADPVRDKASILAVLRRNIARAGSARRYDWLYLDNPHGRARVWLAEDVHSGEVVGTSAGHPKRAWIDGSSADVLNLSDFAVDASYRALGPAMKLLRATLETARSGEFAFLYEHPNPRMMAVYHRMGGTVVSSWRRWVRLLELGGQLERRLGSGILPKLAGRAGDLALRARDRLTRPRSSVEVTLGVPEADGLERLDERLARTTRYRMRRTPDHLSWRYLAHVTDRHEIMWACARGVLIGYLVFKTLPDDVIAVVDLMGEGADALMASLVDLGRARGAPSLWTTVMRDSPVESVLVENRFIPRGEGPGVVVFAPAQPNEAQTALQDPRNWWMLEGDEDV